MQRRQFCVRPNRLVVAVRSLAVALTVVSVAGCRTNGLLARKLAPPLNSVQPLTLERVTPNLAGKLKSWQGRFTTKWTTGTSPVSCETSMALSSVVPYESTSQSFMSIGADEIAAEPTSSSKDFAELIADEALEALNVGANALASQSTDRRTLSLSEAITTALTNSRVIRSDAEFVAGRSGLMESPDLRQTALATEIRDSGFLFGQRGVAAALSEFDTQFNWTASWNRNETIQNNLFLSGGILPGGTLVEDSATVIAELSKRYRTGGRAAVFHNWDYRSSNREDLLFRSAYFGSLGVEFRQPLLAGAGRRFTEIAGHPGNTVQGVTGVSQGVLIARAETEIARTELKASAARFITDVESVYWRLASSNQAVRLAETAVQEAKKSKRTIEAQIRAEADAGELDRLAAIDLVARAETLLAEANQESIELGHRLQRLLSHRSDTAGLPVPAEHARMIAYTFDIVEMQSVARGLRPELERQRQRIRVLDKQVQAAQSLLLPRLDGIARYQINGFGDHLIAEPIPGPDESVQSAYHNLFDNEHSGWQLGFQFSHNMGRRLERTRLRNLRLQSRRARTILCEQMIEVDREVSTAIERVDALSERIGLLHKRHETSVQRLGLLETRRKADDEQVGVMTLAEARLSASELAIQSQRLLGDYASALARVQLAIGTTMNEHAIAVVPAVRQTPTL